jgi:hypothetical protein
MVVGYRLEEIWVEEISRFHSLSRGSTGCSVGNCGANGFL